MPKCGKPKKQAGRPDMASRGLEEKLTLWELAQTDKESPFLFQSKHQNKTDAADSSLQATELSAFIIRL